MKAYIAYERVSTNKQSIGLEAQDAAISKYVASVGGVVVGTYREHESGKNDARPELSAAIADCKSKGATLLIAKLDRLSRNVSFLFKLRDSLTAAGVEVVAVDMPEVMGNTLMLSIMAGMAQAERELISKRTKEALAVRKAQGVHIGREKGCDTSMAYTVAGEVHKASADAWAREISPVIMTMREHGVSLAGIAKTLNLQHMPTRRGGAWTATAVKRVVERINKEDPNEGTEEG